VKVLPAVKCAPRPRRPNGTNLMRDAIRCHQRSSEAIRGHQRRPNGTNLMRDAIRGHQRSSEAIRGHQRRPNGTNLGLRT
jgi:hypothetical protein